MPAGGSGGNGACKKYILRMDNRLLFLLGAGGSIPVDYPSTVQLTSILLGGTGFHYHRQLKDRFCFSGNKNPDKMVKLMTDICQLFSCGAENYEVIYNNILKVWRNRDDSNSPFHKNAKSFDNAVDKIMGKYFANLSDFVDMVKGDQLYYHEIYDLALTYISNGVRQILWNHRSKVTQEHFKKIKIYNELLAHQDVEGLDIFTLNHDTLLEDYFSFIGVSYNDFVISRERDKRFIIQDDETSHEVKTQVRLFKLHGSVDWFKSENIMPGGMINFNFIGDKIPFSYRIPYIEKVDDVPAALRCSSATGDIRHNTRRGIVIGVDNKAEDYPQYPYLQHLNNFYHHLNKNDRLVIIGYSYGDRVINEMLGWWRDLKPSIRKTYLITKGSDGRLFAYIPPDVVEEGGIENATLENIIDFYYN